MRDFMYRILDLLDDFYEYYEKRGCFGIVFEGSLLIVAIVSVVDGTATPFWWSIFLGVIADIIFGVLWCALPYMGKKRGHNVKEKSSSKKDSAAEDGTKQNTSCIEETTPQSEEK